MNRKFFLIVIILTVLFLAAGYRAALVQDRAERLIADAYYGQLEDVKEDVEQGAPLDFVLYFNDPQRDYSGVEFNALHAAASGGNEDIINFLLEQGMDIDAQTPDGWTPLFIATRDGRAEAAKLLVFRGARIDVPTSRGATALLMAVTQPYPTEEERLDLVTYLLKRGANPNLAAATGFTPLYYAAAAQKEKVVSLLLEYGAYLDPAAQQQLNKRLKNSPQAQKIAALLKRKAARTPSK